MMISGKNNVPPSVSKRVRLYVDFPPTLWITHQLVGVRIFTNASMENNAKSYKKNHEKMSHVPQLCSYGAFMANNMILHL